MTTLSIIVPAFNEAAILDDTLSRLVEAFPDTEIILVSDGSGDSTEEVAGRFAPAVRFLSYQPNRGKGYAIRMGMLAARGDTLVFTDADLPFGVEGVRDVIDQLGPDSGWDVVIAQKTRLSRGSLYRAARWAVRLLIRAVDGLDLPDTQAGLKGFTRAAARRIFTRTQVNRFAADIEMLYLANREGFSVKSLPMAVQKEPRPSTFNAKQGLYLLADIWKIRLNQARRL
jgi:dolichyl-phosphate beta-glucosyltransferase